MSSDWRCFVPERGAVPEPPWPRQWEAKYRARWQGRKGETGLFPVPEPPKPKRDQVQFFLIIARRAEP